MSRDALVVGINAYQYLPSLNAPARDAEAIAQQLQTYGEFRVTRLPEIVATDNVSGTVQTKVGLKTQVTLRELEAALIRLFKPKGNNIPHTALFYFSGHGLQKDAGIQEGYLALGDSNPEVGFYGLSLFWLRRLLQESPVRQRIIWLDCCHSGELFNMLEADPGAYAGTDRLFMAASREYETAYESLDSAYSVFTQAVLKGLDPKRNEAGVVTNYSLTHAVSNALKAEVQQPLFENSGSEIILTRCTNPPKTILSVKSQTICPYRGLEFFDESHAEYFFGREDLTDQLIDKLRHGKFVAVVGASGSGKSSLLRAGLIHELRKGNKFSGSDRWQIKLITPGEHPLRSLAHAFIDPQATGLERAEQLRRAEAFLKEGGSGLAQLAQASAIASQKDTETHSSAKSRLVLIIDQFEEVFTLGQGPQSEQERYRFFNCLVGALQDAGHYLSIVIGLRADFFGKCSLYNQLAQKIEQNLVTVTPLTYEQIKATIVRPAQKVGLVCEPNLIYTMLLDVVGAPGELPLLQYTLLELWERRQEGEHGEPSRLTLNAYTELGGVRGTLQKRATEIFCSLAPEEQRVAQRIFLALTQLGEGTEDTRRRILKAELISPRFPAELVEQVLEKLIVAKLVVTNQVPASTSQVDETGDPLTLLHPNPPLSTALRFAQTNQDTSRPWTRNSNAAMGSLRSAYSSITGANLPVERNLTSANSAWPPSGSLASALYYETVDVAHEALIRNWSLLRMWLDENREMLRRQRRIEQATREWQRAEQPLEAEYLLRGGRLIDAEDFLHSYPDELSALAQQYVAVSQEESHKAQKESRVLQIAVPCALLMALTVSFNQYRTAVSNQAEKDYQIQVATSRQRAAIAQTILQESDGDPTAALLISRLAAEGGKPTYEAEASLRAALQKLQLQVELRGHQGAVHQVAFSPSQNRIATAGADGTIRIWSLQSQTTERILQWDAPSPAARPSKANPAASATSAPSAITALAFSPDGKQLAAIAKGTRQVRIWAVDSGAPVLQFTGFTGEVGRIAFSPQGQWFAAASADQMVRVWQLETGKLQTQIRHQSPINSIQFSSDGRSLLTASADGKAQIWQVATGRVQKALQHPGSVNQAAFSQGGQWIATACDDGQARLWSAKTGQLQRTFSHAEDAVSGLERSSAAALPLANAVPGSTDKSIDKSGKSTAKPVGKVGKSDRPWSHQLKLSQATPHPVPHQTQAAPIIQVIFSPDEKLLATADPSQQVRLWNLRSGQAATKLVPAQDQPTMIRYAGPEPITFSPDGDYILTTTRNQVGDRTTAYTAHLWDVYTGREVSVLRGHQGAIGAAQFSPDGAYIATASEDSVVRLWATQPGGELPTLAMPEAPIQWATFLQPSTSDTKNGILTAQAEPRGTLELLWSLPSRLNSRLTNAAFSPGVQSGFNRNLASSTSIVPNLLSRMVTASAEGSLQAWHLSGNPIAGHALKTTTAERFGVSITNQATQSQMQLTQALLSRFASGATFSALALSPDGQTLAVAKSDGWIEILQMLSDQKPRLLRRFQSLEALKPQVDANATASRPVAIRQMSFSPDSQKLLGLGDDLTVRLWDVVSGQQLQNLQGHHATIEQAHFSSDNQQVITASWDRTARIWDVASGKLVRLLPHQDVVSSAFFSPDNQLVATASWDGTARVFDAATGVLRVILTGHRGPVLDAEFSPDGRSLVTASADGTARLWETQTGTEQAQLRPSGTSNEPIRVRRAFFSPDGQYVATLGDDGKVRLWAATWDVLLKLARDRTLRQLTPEECIRYLRLGSTDCSALSIPEADVQEVKGAAPKGAIAVQSPN
uniref:nSTAND1 domain-containing NTPase n=1 Tax=Trichocoleus desertorum TaxID=1481672 RepID=UPI0025B61965|nr:caspase family protein [Trichocoleus desertorum]